MAGNRAKRRLIVVMSAVACCASTAMSANVGIADSDSIDNLSTDLDEVVVRVRTGIIRPKGSLNTEVITSAELRRAACCNLGESFTTNPSVDVSYSDAATGARQIRLLGLAGTYVQMLKENVPALRGAASPYGLGYIPGPWIQSMQVSKGASSVKNGYESVTGQINIELKKPQSDPQLSLNMYYDSENKYEVNLDGSLHLGDKWSAGLLTHFDQKFTSHDANDDGFVDMPTTRQINIMPRVAYLGTNFVFQAAAGVLNEKRQSGQDSHSHIATHDAQPLYKINLATTRAEAFAKTAYIFDRENDGNVALIVSGSYHDANSTFGKRICDIDQGNVYAQLMFERKWMERHSLSTGVTMNYDNYHYRLLLSLSNLAATAKSAEHEMVTGAYAQYTLNLDDRFIGMAGVRYDYNSVYGSMFTPRIHLRYNPSDIFSLHASAGRGYHSPHPYAEYSYLLASSRRFQVARRLHVESAWNFGGGASLTFNPFGRELTLSGEYYYTRFANQLLADMNTSPHDVFIFSSPNGSYSHSMQFQLDWNLFDDISLMVAWRMNNVKVNYGNGMQEKPLMSRNKALFTIGYAPNMGIWQFDVSCAINGGGSMPTPYTMADGNASWQRRFNPYPTLNANITRNFRHWSIYVGGENLTGYRQDNPIIDASNPWGNNFDATMIYGPLHGAMIYGGFRYNITKYI